MTEQFLTREQAAELFVNRLITRAYKIGIRDMKEELEEGPSGRTPLVELVALHQWYQRLDDQDREYVLAVIRHVVHSTVFGCLVLLDGAAGYAIPGKVSDFAVYLQTYANIDAQGADSPELRVRVNPAFTTEYLHDMFDWLLVERAERGELDRLPPILESHKKMGNL